MMPIVSPSVAICTSCGQLGRSGKCAEEPIRKMIPAAVSKPSKATARESVRRKRIVQCCLPEASVVVRPVGSIVAPVASCHCRMPACSTRAAWCGARIVNRIPSSAKISSVSKSTAVSGNHSPSGRRLNRRSKSAMPQRTGVRRSRRLASGNIMWLYGCTIAEPCPANFCMLRRSAVQDCPVNFGLRYSPATEAGRAKIKADPGVVVDQLNDLTLIVQDPCY